MKKILDRYRGFKPFSDEEAWMLFKLAAIGEACGWTLLISGILSQKFIVHSNIPVLLAGQLHGMLFLFYLAAVIVFAPSLKWRHRRALVAGLCAVPPYGSLAFELWANSRRQRKQLNVLTVSIFYRQLLGA